MTDVCKFSILENNLPFNTAAYVFDILDNSLSF